MRSPIRPLTVALAAFAFPAGADVVSSSATHFVLRHEAHSTLAPGELWQRLVRPADWWHPDHTYSGDAANLDLELRAGGLWREDWEGGSVAHGRVLYVEQERTLRMEAPFGPLQGAGAYAVWTITIRADDEGGEGSIVVFDEIANGPPTAKLGELAAAVDYVKSEAIRRLAGNTE